MIFAISSEKVGDFLLAGLQPVKQIRSGNKKIEKLNKQEYFFFNYSGIKCKKPFQLLEMAEYLLNNFSVCEKFQKIL